MFEKRLMKIADTGIFKNEFDILEKNIFCGVISGYNQLNNVTKSLRIHEDYKELKSMNLMLITDDLTVLETKGGYNQICYSTKNKKTTFKELIGNALRCNPDIVYAKSNGTDSWKYLLELPYSGTPLLIGSKHNNMELLLKEILQKNTVIDLFNNIDFIYIGMSCVSNEKMHLIEINEYIRLDEIKELIILEKNELIEEIKEIIRKKETGFIHDLEKKYSEGLILKDNYLHYKGKLSKN